MREQEEKKKKIRRSHDHRPNPILTNKVQRESKRPVPEGAWWQAYRQCA